MTDQTERTSELARGLLPTRSRWLRQLRGTLLGRHDLRLLWIGETTSQVGNAITVVALPLVAATTLQSSTFILGVLNAAVWLPWLLIGLPAGVWVDRVAQRPLMMICNLTSMVLLASIPVASWVGLLTMPYLLAVALLAGSSNVFTSTASTAFMPTLVATEELERANALLQGSQQASNITGRGLGGVLVQLLGPAAALLADAASFLVSALCLSRIRTPEPAVVKTADRRSLRSDLSEGVGFVASDPYLSILAIFAAATNLALTGVQTVQVVFIIRDLGMPPSAVGALLTGFGLGGISGAMVANRFARRFGNARAMLVCFFSTAPLGLLIPMATQGVGVILLVVGFVSLGVGIAASNVIVTAFYQAYCPIHMLGRVNSTLRFMNRSAVPVGALVFGGLGSALGNRATLWIALSGLVFAGYPLLMKPLRGRRDFPTREAAGGEVS